MKSSYMVYRYNSLVTILMPVLFLLAFSGCGSKTVNSDINTAEGSNRAKSEQEISPQGYDHFVNANLLELDGSYGSALSEYQNALKYFPESQTIRTDYARLLFRTQNFDEALKQAIMIEPKSAETYLLLGDCYRLIGNADSAIAAYNNTIELDRDNINAYWYLAGYYSQMGKIDEAISSYYEIARLTDTYRVWQELGTLLGQSGRYAEALEAFKKTIENSEQPGVTPYLGLAASYDALDSLPQAEAALEKAIEIDRYDVRIFRQMEAMYRGRDMITETIEANKKLVALVPSDWVSQRRLGILLFSDGQLKQADSLFADRISFGDENILNYFYRGLIAIEQERWEPAAGFMQDAIKLDDSFMEGWLNLGYVYTQMDSLDQAIVTYNQGLARVENDEGKIRLLFALGAALERNNQFYEAVETLRELISIDSNNAQALNYLGYMLADRNEQLTYALELIEKAISIAPDNGAYIDSYGWVQYRLGNYEMALTELKKAVDLIGDDAVIYEHLGDVYEALGDRNEAERHYRRALELDPDSINLEEKLGR